MAQYFFKMTNEERNNILDQHKTIYDGYVTEYAQGENKQPLYVQDFANDKGGITVNNKGVVKNYTNMNINEIHTGLDMIGGDQTKLHDNVYHKHIHLKNGTVDFSSIDNDEDDSYISLGITNVEDEDDYKGLSMYNSHYGDKNFDFDNEEESFDDEDQEYNRDEESFDIELDEINNKILDLKPEWTNHYEEEEIVNDLYDDGFDEIEEEEKYELLNKLNESLDMFSRFKKYN